MRPLSLLCALLNLLFLGMPSYAQNQTQDKTHSGETHSDETQVLAFQELKPKPKDILSRMPRGARSLNFGSIPMGPNNSDILIHIYTLSSRTDARQVNRMDLFQWHQSKGRMRLSRLHSLNIDSDGDANPAGVLPYARWLDTQNQRFPVLITYGQGGFGGYAYVFVFAKGLSSPPVLQKFDYYWNIGHGHSSVTFDKVDERGFMEVVQKEHLGSSEPSPSDRDRETVLYWNGSEFVPRDDRKRDLIYLSVGVIALVGILCFKLHKAMNSSPIDLENPPRRSHRRVRSDKRKA
jgi:hypothetical protein